MKTFIPLLMMIFIGLAGNTQTTGPAKAFEKDTFTTEKGPLVITFVGHGTLMIEACKTVIHIDPVSREADYTLLPKADLILITHEHGDHLDKKALALITQPQTIIIVSQSCKGQIENSQVMLNGESQFFEDFKIEAVPAYNIVNMRPDGGAYHPKGNGNGYIINFGGKRIHIGGDTENTPEMAFLKNIDIAFLPMNLPYTMTPQMMADGARTFKPAILYPYHFGETDPQILVDLLKDTKIEVRVRKMK